MHAIERAATDLSEMLESIRADCSRDARALLTAKADAHQVEDLARLDESLHRCQEAVTGLVANIYIRGRRAN